MGTQKLSRTQVFLEHGPFHHDSIHTETTFARKTLALLVLG
jgi:hypothetical protein